MMVWINNDQDTDAGDVTPVRSPDYGNDQIQTIRDLEDFARMNILVQGITNEIVQGTFKIGLKWKNTTGYPVIKLWKNKSPNGDMEYLTNTNVAQQFLTLQNPGEVAWTETYFIPTNFWADMIINTTNSTGYLLFEGCSVGKGQLVLTINKHDGTELAEAGGVWLDLEDISTMYEQAIVTDDMTGAISNWTSTVTVQNPLPANPGEDQNIIVFVHGINVSLLDWYVDSDTVFKRLFWSGYQGKFATVKWPCHLLTPPDVWDLDVFNYSELNAYKASFAMTDYLNQLRTRFPNYRLNILAHSQGNAVVSEAIKHGAPFDTYVLTQGAMPASAYDMNAPTDPDLTSREFPPYLTPEWQPMGYHGAYTNLPGRMVSYYNTNDTVLGFWTADQYAFKPADTYSYIGTNGLQFLDPGYRLVTDSQESRSMISRSRTWSIGAQRPSSGQMSEGVISSTVDLAGQFGFTTGISEHSAEWNRPIQTSLSYYIQVIDSIKP